MEIIQQISAELGMGLCRKQNVHMSERRLDEFGFNCHGRIDCSLACSGEIKA